MKFEDIKPRRVNGFYFPVSAAWLEENIKPRLTQDEWHLYSLVLTRAIEQETPKVKLTRAETGLTQPKLARAREVLRWGWLNVEGNVYEIRDPRDFSSLEPLPQRKVVSAALASTYPVREYTKTEIETVVMFLLGDRQQPGRHVEWFFWCPFHDTRHEKRRNNYLFLNKTTGIWGCKSPLCRHYVGKDKTDGYIGRSIRSRRGNDLPSLVANLKLRSDLRTGKDNGVRTMLPAQAREVIEDILTGNVTKSEVTFTCQNPVTRESIMVPYVRPATLPEGWTA